MTVKPAVYTEKEQEIRAFSGLVKQEEEAQKGITDIYTAVGI